LRYFKYNQKELLGIANSSLGRYMLAGLGQKPVGKIVCVTPNSFIERIGHEYRGTFFSRDPLIRLAIQLETGRFDRPMMFDSATFNPAAGANSPVDGWTSRGFDDALSTTGLDEAFGTLRAGAGTGKGVTTTTLTAPYLASSTTSDQYAQIIRNIFCFGTSTLGGTALVSAATFSVYGQAAGVEQLAGYTVGVVATTPAATNTLAASDYGQFGTTDFATRIAHAAWNAAGYNDFVLNAAGISNISTTGVSKFGTRQGQDIDNSAPTWGSGQASYVGFNFADVGSNLPKLVVTFTLVGGDTGSYFM